MAGTLHYYWFVFRESWLGSHHDFVQMLMHPSAQNPYYVAPAVLLGIYLLEFVIPWRKQQSKLRPHQFLDLFYTLSTFVLFWWAIGNALCKTTEVAFFNFRTNILGIEDLMLLQVGNLPVWMRYVLVLLFSEFVSYWSHRIMHQSDILWQFHKVHHSSHDVDVLNANRLHFGELLWNSAFMYLPGSAIGFAVEDSFAVGLFRSTLSNFTHANIRIPFGPFKYVLNSPQMHIWHHARDVNYKRNVNYGDALSVWDYVFRTAYTPEERTNLKLGFENVEEYPTSFTGQFFDPFIQIGSAISQKLGIEQILKSIGFRPIDDDDATST